MNCPKCELTLEAALLPTKLTVDYCGECRGAFYDAGEIKAPLGDGAPRDAVHTCPKCPNVMTAMDYFDGRLTVERCGSCGGIWFDAGEILKFKELAGGQEVVGPDSSEFAGAQDAPAKGLSADQFFSALYDVSAQIAQVVIDSDSERARRRRRGFF